ncbi:hypothetical protein [Aurantiacibacter sp. MUD61]|uniref:hypothetical protein n=1 Tax=Aurantiacibacter sp. MUD61 TaxID=3009083 RepID=UPI0022F08639|nr:hypothetical protein [Aurantiacibacter sp. MUD61]
MRKLIWASLACASLIACSGDETAEPEADEAAEAETTTDASSVDATQDEEDALVDGTEYNATTILDCGFDGAEPTQSCDAGVVRNWMEDGSHLVEVQKPDGFKRALFFDGTTPVGADSAEADGSAGWDFDYTRDGDQVTIQYGPESYVIVDALITGG